MDDFARIDPRVLWTLAGLFGALSSGTLIRLSLSHGAEGEDVKDRINSLKTWWVLVVLFALSVLVGRFGVAILFTAASCLAMREYLRIVRPQLDAPGFGLACLLIGLNYLWIALGWWQLAFVFLPLCGFLVLSTIMVFRGDPREVVSTTASFQWGLLLTGYCLSHAVMLYNFRVDSNPPGEGIGLFLFLVILTQGHDILQAQIGRRYGIRKLAPVLSPNKTWEGFLGSLIVTVLLAGIFGPWLTPFDSRPGGEMTIPFVSVFSGLLISVMGLLGDLGASVLKRNAGVKDSGTLLPGQGGILDRIDSLTFTAPTFYYFVLLVR